MKVVVCLCDRGGMLFNNRRQSRDRILINNLVEYIDDGALFVNEFSSPLFSNSDSSVIEVSNPLEVAKENDFVFVENLNLSKHKGKISEMVIYKWNRSYPCDFFLDVMPSDIGLALREATEFEGSSHDKITREVYTP